MFCLRLQEKESLESKNRLLERELSEIKDKLQVVSRGLNNAATNISSQEATIDSLKSNTFFININGLSLTIQNGPSTKILAS